MQHSWLRSFHYTATLERISAAAAKLNVAGSSISTQIRQLEAYFGVRLFMRERNRLILTEVGERLVEDTKRYFELEGTIRRRLGEAYAGSAPKIRIGSEHPAVTALVTNQIASDTGIPGNYSVFGGSRDVLHRWFLEHRIDVILNYTPEDEVEAMAGRSVALRTDRAEFVAGAHFAKRMSAGGSDKSIERLLQTETWILQKRGSTTRQVFDEMCGRLDALPNTVIEMPSYADVVGAVKEDLGIGLLIRNSRTGTYYGQPRRRLVRLDIGLPSDLAPDLEPLFTLRKYIHCQDHAAKLAEVRRFVDHCIRLNTPAMDEGDGI